MEMVSLKGLRVYEVPFEWEAVQGCHGCYYGLLGATEGLSSLRAGRTVTHTQGEPKRDVGRYDSSPLGTCGVNQQAWAITASGPATPPQPQLPTHCIPMA